MFNTLEGSQALLQVLLVFILWLLSVFLLVDRPQKLTSNKYFIYIKRLSGSLIILLFCYYSFKLFPFILPGFIEAVNKNSGFDVCVISIFPALIFVGLFGLTITGIIATIRNLKLL